jgi:hypothetical protein
MIYDRNLIVGVKCPPAKRAANVILPTDEGMRCKTHDLLTTCAVLRARDDPLDVNSGLLREEDPQSTNVPETLPVYLDSILKISGKKDCVIPYAPEVIVRVKPIAVPKHYDTRL